MSEDKDPPSTLDGAGIEIIVKGGTTPSSYDQARAEQRRVAEIGRAHQDKQMLAAAQGDQLTTEGFVSSRLHSLRMMDSGAPRVVLYYLNRDRTVRQECVSEIAILADGDQIFTLVCPKCLERGEPPDSSQLMVRKSHRKWFLDTKRQGQLVELVDPWGQKFSVRICGTVYSEETLRCTNFNCAWAVRVEDSKVVEV